MSGVTRQRFGSTFANAAIDLRGEGVGEALAGAGLDVGKLDALDGKADGRVAGAQPLDELYDAINRLDTTTGGLASKAERGVWEALRGAAVLPQPISAAQGEALARVAQQIVAEDDRTSSPWAKESEYSCANPAISSPEYASKKWKCNVFVGEAFYRAGLPFPVTSTGLYTTANGLAAQSRFFRPVGRLDDVRPGDLLTIRRNGESGHVEIVTQVRRDPDGRIVAIAAAGAHEKRSQESTNTATDLIAAAGVNGGAATALIDGETFGILRPLAPPRAEVAR
jgi:hypothetical protein